MQLAWSAGEQSPTVWADLITKIKEGLLSALDNAVSSREEELKRSEGQRHMPGWNFCTYFVLKASLEVFIHYSPTIKVVAGNFGNLI